MREIIMYGHGGAFNHGAEAIVKTTIAGIRQQIPGARVLLSTHFEDQDRQFGIPADVFLCRDNTYVQRERSSTVEKGAFNKDIYRSTVERINENATLLSVGGDNYCYAPWHRFKYIHDEAAARGARDILWGCSIGEEYLTSEMIETLATHTYILARESMTYDLLRAQGLDNVKLCADTAFLLEPKSVTIPKSVEERGAVAINISPLIQKRASGKENILQAFKALIEYIFMNTSMCIVLLPHVMMPTDNDYEALKALKDLYMPKYSDRIILCGGDMSAAEYKYIISRCRFGVFARTHASIAAYSTGIPTVVVGYSIKAQGIARDMEMGRYVIDASQVRDKGVIVEAFLNLMQQEQEIRSTLVLHTNEMKSRAIGMFSYL